MFATWYTQNYNCNLETESLSKNVLNRSYKFRARIQYEITHHFARYFSIQTPSLFILIFTHPIFCSSNFIGYQWTNKFYLDSVLCWSLLPFIAKRGSNINSISET